MAVNWKIFELSYFRHWLAWHYKLICQNQAQHRKWLKNMNNSDTVSSDLYKALKQEFEDERISHLQTKKKLLKTSEKLKVALSEIQSLNRQLQQEKDSFKEAFGHLKDTAFEQKYHALMLKEKCNEIEKVCEHQNDLIQVKEEKIIDLQTQLQNQKRTHSLRLTDQEIHIQQERYLTQNLYKTYPTRKK